MLDPEGQEQDVLGVGNAKKVQLQKHYKNQGIYLFKTPRIY